ncbi:MAG TPA: TolC family protein, partial [Phycisphaerales bacterium]|nr:TolC family protein [Phycisphaerales bacterium]
LSVPLGNERARSQLRKVLYQRRQHLATRQARQLLIKQEVLAALDQVETNWQQILANRQNALLQGRLYQAEIRQFEVGERTSTDVLQAQTNFANAQSGEIRALVEYEIALVDLAYATGTLLGASRVDWEPAVPDIGVRP